LFRLRRVSFTRREVGGGQKKKKTTGQTNKGRSKVGVWIERAVQAGLGNWFRQWKKTFDTESSIVDSSHKKTKVVTRKWVVTMVSKQECS